MPLHIYTKSQHSQAQPNTAKHSQAQPITAKHSQAQPSTAKHSQVLPFLLLLALSGASWGTLGGLLEASWSHLFRGPRSKLPPPTSTPPPRLTLKLSGSRPFYKDNGAASRHLLALKRPKTTSMRARRGSLTTGASWGPLRDILVSPPSTGLGTNHHGNALPLITQL